MIINNNQAHNKITTLLLGRGTDTIVVSSRQLQRQEIKRLNHIGYMILMTK